MTEVDLKFDDCRKCIRFKLDRARARQVETAECRECDSGEFYEPKRADTVSMFSRSAKSR